MKTKNNKCYIAGKITGEELGNAYNKFESAEKN